MSNVPTATKAIIAIVSIIILASGIFVLTKSRQVETPSIATSSSSVSSLISSTSKTALSLSSQSQTVSSSLQAVSKTVEVTKPSEVATVPQPQTPCNQPDSPDLVKTEDGCFTLLISGQNSDTANLQGIFKSISKDFFNKIISYTKNTDTIINIDYRSNSQEYPVYISANINKVFDQNKNLPNFSLFNSFYSIKNDTPKFLFFELRGDGQTQNINDVVNEYKEYLKI
jgi:hypothetical protein